MYNPEQKERYLEARKYQYLVKLQRIYRWLEENDKHLIISDNHV